MAHATIRQGSKGTDVTLWQKVIGVKADGNFGPGTATVTKNWQKNRGLPADGVVGPNSWNKAQQVSPNLFKTAPKPAPKPAHVAATQKPKPKPVAHKSAATPAKGTMAHATIRQGSKGPDVVLWQKVVGTDADGAFGPHTAQLTKTWQAGHSLSADGVVGPASWAKAEQVRPELFGQGTPEEYGPPPPPDHAVQAAQAIAKVNPPMASAVHASNAIRPPAPPSSAHAAARAIATGTSPPKPTPKPSLPMPVHTTTAEHLALPKDWATAKADIEHLYNSTPLWLKIVTGIFTTGLTFLGIRKVIAK